MTWFPFHPQVALDITGGLASAGVGQVYATSDTGFTTPLAAVDVNDSPLATISVSAIGVTQFFKVEDKGSVMWKSGSLPAVALISAEGFLAASQAAASAAADSADAATALADLVTAGTDGQVAGFIDDPNSLTRAALAAALPSVGDSAPVAAWIPRSASYSTIEDKLTDWRTSLGGTGLTQVVAVGDSITEGTGTTDVSLRWINRLQSFLRYRTGRTTGAEWPFIPSYPITSAPGFPVSRSGTVTLSNAYGLGWRTAIIGTDGSLTFTFTGTSFKVPHLKASGTGKMRIVIDGGAATVVDTNSLTNPPGANSAVWSSPALTAGEHTVIITRDATSASGQNPFVQGLITYNGDETSGVRVLDAAYHGIATSFFTSGRNTQMASAIASAGGASLLIIAVGTNDYGAGTVPATYKTAITDFITAVRAGGFSGSVALVNMYSNVTRDEDNYAVYGAKMREIAVADAKVSYFDLRLRMPDIPNPVTDPASLGLFADGLHPSDAGSQWMGYVFADYLALRS